MALKRDRVTAPELEEFVVLEVHLTGVNLGTGAYGAVEEATIPGATVAAKKLHPELVNLGSPEQVQKWIDAFVEECKLMCHLRHPHVVQFMGICYFPESHLPVLLMEKLQTSLDSFLETTPNIPLDVKVHLLTGISRGVVYLHSRAPPVIHRDLTARNILISSELDAKIADLGVARMVNIQPGQRAATMTQGPGNGLYMPPETVPGEEAARYNTPIDIFSFGVVGLFTLTQTFPKNLKPASYFDPVMRRVLGRTEVERRQEYVNIMKRALGNNDPLVRLTVDCLEYLPEDRPSAEEVLTRLEEVRISIPERCSKSKLELIQGLTRHEQTEVQREHERQLTEKQAQIQQLQTTNIQRQARIHGLQATNRLQQVRIDGLQSTNRLQQARIDSLQVINSQQQAQIDDLQVANRQQQEQIDSLLSTSSQQEACTDGLQAANIQQQAKKQEQVNRLEELTTLQQQQLEDQRREIERLSDQLRSLPLEGAVHRPQGAGQREVTHVSGTSDTALTRHHPQAKPLPRPRTPSSITFNWRRYKDIPHEVYYQPVDLDNERLYIRGNSHKGRDSIHEYRPAPDLWVELPEPPVYNFTIATHNGQLLVVGGKEKFANKTTNTILTFDEHSRQWVQSYPVMPTALYWTAVIGYQNYLIVAGGCNAENDKVADVNSLNTSTGEWIKAESLTTTAEYYRIVLVEDTVYIVGQNTKHVQRAHVPTLTSGVRSHVWERVMNTPFYWSIPVTVDNTLLAVGGRNAGNPTSNIHMYDPTKNQWTKVGDLPEPMENCRCAALSGELFVLGSSDSNSICSSSLN